MFQDINIQEARQNRSLRFIDVRSPGEYAQGTIPGAVNIPLLDDNERALVGTTYKQKGSKQATELAMEIVSPKIPHYMRELTDHLRDGQAPLIFCWRGGKRSKAMATFADLFEIPVYRLEGGYRAYREYVVERLSRTKLGMPTIVLHGLTGVGKTLILERLEARGEPVLDLEKLAGHRGSAFGSLGEITPRNQKSFDSLLLEKIEELEHAPYVFVEAESKRIGRVLVPDFIMQAKEKGVHLYMEAPMELRVKRILDEYHPEGTDEQQFQQKVLGAISRIEKKLASDVRNALKDSAEAQNYAHLVFLLLTEYYDPRYEYTMKQYENTFHYVDATDLDRAADKCQELGKNVKEAAALGSGHSSS